MFKTQSKTKVSSDGLKAECIPPCSEGGGGGQFPKHTAPTPCTSLEGQGTQVAILSSPRRQLDVWLALPAPSTDLLCDLEPGTFVPYPGQGRKREGRKLRPKEIERFVTHCSGARKLPEIINRKG